MEEMTNIIPSMRFDEFKYSWKVTTLGEITRQYRESNKNVHHQNLLSLSYGKIVRKDIESKKGLLPASFDTYQIIKKDIIVFRVTDLQNDKKSLRVGISEEEGIITPAYVCVECDTRVVDPHYLYTLLHYYDDITKVYYALCTGLSPDWNNSYEQYHDSFNIIADMRNANDLLTRFLKMYQVLEFFTFRLKLIPLTKGQATRNSFISNVRHTVDTISKGELKSLQDLFAKVFNSIHNTEVKNLVEPIQTNNIKLSKYLNQTLTRQIKSILGLTNQNISNPSNVAELIYKIRCCIVHSKESEIHFTPNNISEYKDLIPVMRVLIKVIQNSIVETINNSGKKDLEFQSESMLLY